MGRFGGIGVARPSCMANPVRRLSFGLALPLLSIGCENAPSTVPAISSTMQAAYQPDSVVIHNNTDSQVGIDIQGGNGPLFTANETKTFATPSMIVEIGWRTEYGVAGRIAYRLEASAGPFSIVRLKDNSFKIYGPPLEHRASTPSTEPQAPNHGTANAQASNPPPTPPRATGSQPDVGKVPPTNVIEARPSQPIQAPTPGAVFAGQDRAKASSRSTRRSQSSSVAGPDGTRAETSDATGTVEATFPGPGTAAPAARRKARTRPLPEEMPAPGTAAPTPKGEKKP
jgi:hypothetical protein